MILETCALIFPTTLVFYGVPEIIILDIVILYCSAVMYSLWRKFKEEEEQALPVTTCSLPQPEAPQEQVDFNTMHSVPLFVNNDAATLVPFSPPAKPPGYSEKYWFHQGFRSFIGSNSCTRVAQLLCQNFKFIVASFINCLKINEIAQNKNSYLVDERNKKKIYYCLTRA